MIRANLFFLLLPVMFDEAQTARSIASVDTVYSADSTEFCPFSEQADILACGTYQLTEEQQNDARVRKGRLYIYKVDPYGSKPLERLQTIETPAILDMKWNHALVDDRQVLGVVDSIGGLKLYGLTSENVLEEYEHIQVVEDHSILNLSLDWASRVYRDVAHSCSLAISHSNGRLSLLRANESAWLIERQWLAHDLEAWIVGYNYWDTNVIYSGADDCIFKGWDARSGQNIFTNRRQYTMGVTAIQSSPHQEHVLATGSYDEHIHIWDTRSMTRPLSENHTPGGGIWRLKWHPTRSNRLLSASMHAGAFVIDTDNASIVKGFLEHESMAYGADWSFQHPNFVASCSFYDHVMHLWDGGSV